MIEDSLLDVAGGESVAHGSVPLASQRRRSEAELPRGQLPVVEFRTADLSCQDQFDGWRDSFSAMFEFSHPASAAEFSGSQAIWDLGSLLFTRIATDGLSFAGLRENGRRDPLDHWIVTQLTDGRSYTVGPHSNFDGGAGSVQVHQLSRVFSGTVTDSEMLMLVVPRDLGLDVNRAMEGSEFSTLPGAMGALLADYMKGLARHLPQLDKADVPSVVEATRGMLLACATPNRDRIEEADGPIMAVLMQRARRLIQDRLNDPTLGPETLRRELGLSRSRLYRMFEVQGGVVRYIQHRRLVDAHAALANPDERRRIVEIAEQHGFRDGTEFSRAFRREFGCSPSDVRMMGRLTMPLRRNRDWTDVPAKEMLGLMLRRLSA